ncbi:MAG: class I SAM-dependent methyltransferase [Dehalococcoidia bacterium]|nr:MAG: class I SAM-dependent methyltransferase [Dehalococcoidia bacterium]
MPRLESLAVGGYFPTPPEVVAHIGAMIRPATHGGRVAVRLIDPCAGTGAALQQLAATIGGETYGIELEADRYEEAAGVLDHALPGNALTARIGEAGFSCLFLNPPYDVDLDARRLEHTFLTAMTKALRPGGLLIYIVPQRRLATSARYIAGHYRDLDCWRFPDGLHKRFEQVVLFGTMREAPVSDAAARATVESWASGPLPELPVAGTMKQPRALPVLPAGDVLFTSFNFDPSEAAAEARRSGVWTHASLTERLWPPEQRKVRPLMPLRRGHLAVMVAAGFLDSVVLHSGQQRLLVKGRTYKESISVYSPDPEVEVEREVMRTSVAVLNLRTGEVEVIDTGASDTPRS